MRYHICHTTIYTYNQPVFLNPHLLRLRPRCNGWQKLHSFSLAVDPEPAGVSQITDLDGNNFTKLWFKSSTDQLKLQVTAEVETYKTNPFDYLLESWALKLPIDYSSSLLTQLQPYLQSYSFAPDPVAAQLAQEIYHEVNGETLSFLSTLNQCLYESCEYIIRETGKPLPAGVTWNSKRGSCRDLAVLFMEVCRAVGLGSRFVSGYQEGDSDQEERDLHAWAEVYLPGGGWQGYDPTHGLAVADRHVALAASALPSYAAPVVGTVTPIKSVLEGGKAAESQMQAHISIQSQ
ncbi:MAG: transglutaminase N-terminal domain-containing protein [Xenococcaceae cyanobacterium]